MGRAALKDREDPAMPVGEVREKDSRGRAEFSVFGEVSV